MLSVTYVTELAQTMRDGLAVEAEAASLAA
jgi:hypothetical protein